jgi:hypothetical protein
MSLKPNWHFLTFGGGNYHYRRSVNRLALQANKSKLFTRVYGVDDLSLKHKFHDFWLQHQDFIQSNKRGFGRWIWKPFLVLNLMEKIKIGDGVFYLDSGSYLNLNNKSALKRLTSYQEECKKIGIHAGQLNPIESLDIDFSERNWTRKSVLDRLNVSSLEIKTGQIQATYVMLVKNQETLNFAKEWYENCIDTDYFNLRDGGEEENYPTFTEHRWDQSVFSCLYKNYSFPKFKDETWWGPDWSTNGANYPIWAMRNRTGIDPFKKRLRDFPEVVGLKNKTINKILERVY